MQDVIIIGAGPCGLSAAIECGRRGLSTHIIEKHCLVHSIFLYPTHMQFFSTSEQLEIGDVPFASPNEKPFRYEALSYYRRVADHYNLSISQYEEAISVERKPDQTFVVHTVDRYGEKQKYEARHVVISTGYFDHPNYIGIPGEDLDKVTHYFREAHPYTGMKVAIIGGSNSAVDAAMELIRVGAQIDMIYRGETVSENIKPWVRPVFEAMVEKDKIKVHVQSKVTEIRQDSVIICDHEGNQTEIENDFVLALTGFRPDRKLLTSCGVELDGDMEKPLYNPETMESNVPGLYVAGVIASGRNANEVFIETGRKHGLAIAKHIAGE
ncbi:YpdA family putative bacillithiol disulfide reductase [Paenibacillus sp.]|jgi:thioredoxin reductase (NADPH)|uniref:YpdA family putative bacillithiol disulfide reductase n=1 Tax=Paenibacillus sp. TaxID=58172 RepID=UPI00281A03E3|nr:YpdA family putative bacillithiol disulfide reductase [Paenibacillus sp.]MDR0266672.1 YpdA family putative bacillithiol disulfide reductase [Paenibacillus sp.]